MTDDDYLWDPSATPDPDVARLEASLRRLRYRPTPFAAATIPAGGWLSTLARSRRTWGAVAAGLVAVAGARALSRRLAEPWAVAAPRGASLGAARVGAGSRLTPGAWLQTGATGEASVNVGLIGQAVFGPNSKVRLVRAQGTEHRLSLERGSMHARIWAPPRFFLVETPGALAVDLGCVYSLTVSPDGSGVLRVESGQVELVEGPYRALVVAGNAASLRRGGPPGLPYPVDAPAAFRNAVAAYERHPSDASVDDVLALSDRRTTTTLWHLLGRVDLRQRERVLDRLRTVAPMPEGVTELAVLQLDRRALDRWKDQLEDSWTTDSVPSWKRAWRRLWRTFLTLG